MLPSDMETLLAERPAFAMLRPDERVRLGEHFEERRILPAAPLVLVPEEPRLVLVKSGKVRFRSDHEETLFSGDAIGVIALCTRRGLSATLTSDDARVLLLDRPAFDAILAEFPIVARSFLLIVAQELKWHDDLLREVAVAHAESLPGAPLISALRRRQRRLERRHKGLVRPATTQILRRLVLEPRRQPAFWALVGFGLAILVARQVVGAIIRSGAQKHFFALIGGAEGNPIHIHHFNYGLILLSVTGMAALLPQGRQVLRLLAFCFGFGLGLVVDEFALLWNLNPDYYQRSSKLAMLLAGAVLIQFVYLRTQLSQLFDRLKSRILPGRRRA